MNQSTLEALLGRSLTTNEVTNLKLYLQIANQSLSELLCSPVEQQTGDRVYDARGGYRTVYTDIFNNVTAVKVDGEAVTSYTARQWDKRNATWYNSIVFTNDVDGEVTVTADWGFEQCLPVDLQLLQAQLFALVGKNQTNVGNVKSQKIEDYSVTYSDNTIYQQFAMDNAATISKYNQCEIENGGIKHGDTYGHLDYDLHY